MSKTIDQIPNLLLTDRSTASYENTRFFVDGMDFPVSLIQLLQEIIRRLNLSVNPDGSETIVNAGANVTVTGSGTAADPYVISGSAGGSGDGSETIVNAGANVTVTGSGTAADPYIIASTSNVDGSETIVNAGANVTVTGSGTAADPYVISGLAGGSGDGSETIVNAGANVTVRGSGTAADPYVIASTDTVADGSETIVNAGANVTVTGSGTAADPYVISGLAGGSADGSETIVNAGANVTVTGSGTAADPYVIASAGGAATVERDSLSIGVFSMEVDRIGGTPCTLANPSPGEYVLTIPAGAHIAGITAFGNNTTLDASQDITIRLDNSANGQDRRYVAQLYVGNDGAIANQFLLGTIHSQTVSANITTVKYVLMNGYGSPGFFIELR